MQVLLQANPSTDRPLCGVQHRPPCAHLRGATAEGAACLAIHFSGRPHDEEGQWER